MQYTGFKSDQPIDTARVKLAAYYLDLKIQKESIGKDLNNMMLHLRRYKDSLLSEKDIIENFSPEKDYENMSVEEKDKALLLDALSYLNSLIVHSL